MRDPFVEHARQLIDQGKVAQARRLLLECVRLNERDPEAWLLLGSIAAPRAQVAYLRRALVLEPDYTDAKLALAQALAGLEPRATPEAVRSLSAQVALTELKTPVETPSIARRRPNLALILGWVIVGLALAIALFGPRIAPKDPTLSVFILQDNRGVWTKPPFAAFAVPGYWLGSDSQGRDYLSQLLWAVRPTMTLVVTVALVRLLIGTIIGAAAGWSDSRMGRTMEALITAALTAPTLIVALTVIAMIGIESGIVAFGLGLSLSGWAEVARMVRQQTRGIRRESYIEAARAVGHSEFGIVWNHVLRQLQPILLMLFAFEISSTLLTTAALGFLGYYLGGGVWFQTGDFVMQRIAGAPELGQMLAIAAATRTRPEAMFFSGSVVFITVMGFNLLGEGLSEAWRREVQFGLVGAGHRFNLWIGDHIFRPAAEWAGQRPAWTGLVSAALIVIAVAGWFGWHWYWAQTPKNPVTEGVAVAGGNLWASERRDAQGTLTIQGQGPDKGKLLWTWSAQDRLVGGPVVDASGTLYVAGASALYAIESTGTLRWESPLAQPPIGSPALGADGSIYLADSSGGLEAFASSGASLWKVNPEGQSKSIAGPIVSLEGRIFYPTDGSLRGVAPSGKALWRSDIPYSYISPLPRLDLAGKTVIFQDLLIDAADGKRLNSPTDNPLDWFMVGADGRLYLQEETSVTEWRPGELALKPVTWNLTGFTYGFPSDSGVTADGFVWLAFINGLQDTRVVWADLQGNVLGQLAAPQRVSRIIGVDGRATLYVCGLKRIAGLGCFAYDRGSQDPKWELALDRGASAPVGGALLEGRLYLAAENGKVFAIGR